MHDNWVAMLYSCLLQARHVLEHWLRKGYGDVRPWRPPFHASPAARKGPISSKRVSSQDSFLRQFGNFSLNSLNFPPNFSSQVPKFGNFQLRSPLIWKSSAHKPPNLEIFRSQAPLFRGKCQYASPTLRKSGPHTPTWKKVECPPPPGLIYECDYLLWESECQRCIRRIYLNKSSKLFQVFSVEFAVLTWKKEMPC